MVCSVRQNWFYIVKHLQSIPHGWNSMEVWLWTSSLICGKAFLGWGRKSIQSFNSYAYFLFVKPCASFPCQPHRSCKGSCRQPDKESGHRVGSLWSPCQCYSTSEWGLGFNWHKHCKFTLSDVCIDTVCRVQSFQKLQWRTTRILGLSSSGCQFHIALLKG